MKVAWFGHKAQERSDGPITYSKGIIKGLGAWGPRLSFSPLKFSSLIPAMTSPSLGLTRLGPKRLGPGGIPIVATLHFPYDHRPTI